MEQFQIIGDHIVNLILSIPAQYYGIAIGSLGVIASTGAIKKVIKAWKDIEKSKWFGVLFLGVTMFYSLIEYVAANAHGLQASLPHNFGILLAGATAIYHGFVYPTKTIYKYIQSRKDAVIAKGEEIEAAALADEIPGSLIGADDPRRVQYDTTDVQLEQKENIGAF